jgi:hypothetical protein
VQHCVVIAACYDSSIYSESLVIEKKMPVLLQEGSNLLVSRDTLCSCTKQQCTENLMYSGHAESLVECSFICFNLHDASQLNEHGSL